MNADKNKYGGAGTTKAEVPLQQSTRDKAGDRKVVGFTITKLVDIEMAVVAKHQGLKKYELLEKMWEEYKERHSEELLGIF